MARTLSKELLPPGATAWAWKGELYILGDGGKVTNIDGREVALPDDFPSDADLKAQREKAERFAPGAAPLEKTIAEAEHAPAKSTKK